MDDGSWLLWMIAAVLIFCAAWFAITETAFASVSRAKIRLRLDKGDRRGIKAGYVLDNFENAITTILIGSNIVHLTQAALVTVIVTKKWGLSFVAVATIITTVVVFLAGEMLPKSIGKKYSEKFALANAATLCFFMRICAPLSKCLTAIGNAAAKHTKGDIAVSVTEDELYDIIEDMTEDGKIDVQHGELIQSALMFDDIGVKRIMTPLDKIAAVNINDSCRQILNAIKTQHHSRLPVYRGSTDNIVGILHIRRYIRAYFKDGEKVDLLSVMDKAYYIPENRRIDDLLPELSAHKQNMAIVVDASGSALGLVTVEDILEELVGEIWDEDDEVIPGAEEGRAGV
ncbi:MAG: HlyC/CorC family transporter [Oscillospiraceae bacterium]|nr:HlyC/CorC family transporter [Oscillospiraceae bacterium]